jgi:hypothetical protein
MYYSIISYKDNDFMPSIDIYNKVNITMAIYVRKHFYIWEVWRTTPH